MLIYSFDIITACLVVAARPLKLLGHLPHCAHRAFLLKLIFFGATLSNHFTLSRNQDNKSLCKNPT